MKRIWKHFIGWVFVMQAILAIFTVVYGIYLQVRMLVTHSYLNGYFRVSWYVYLGSWVMFVFLIRCAVRCIRASIHYKDWRYVLLTGCNGMLAYAVPILTFTIFFGRFNLGSPFAIIPLCIAIIGIRFKSSDEQTNFYVPAFSWLNRKRQK